MNSIFQKHLRRFVLVFFDDILVYSKTWAEHILHLQQVLNILKEHQFFAKYSKCHFGVPQVDYLGHIISAKGVAVDPSKIEAMVAWPAPKTLTALRGFLGLTGYYRRFVRNYAAIAAPLSDLLKKSAFSWSTDSQQPFEELKQVMVSLPILALPNFLQEFEVTTDASGTAIGAVLSQGAQPLAFFSKKLCPQMQAASAYDREMLAITEAVKKWRQYLLGRHFRIFTDHMSLKNLLSQTIQTLAQQKWLTKLLGYDFEILYKPGKENVVADALSRITSDDPPVYTAISTCQPLLLTQLQEFYQLHEGGKLLFEKLTSTNRQTPSPFTRQQGIVFYKGRMFIPEESDLRTPLLQEFHSSAVGGHSGIQGTLSRLAAVFAWTNMIKDVKNYVKTCEICQANKASNHKPYGLLQPLPIPQQAWEDISMDFVTHLPPSNGKTTILVIVDRFSKSAHFIPLPTHYTAMSLAPLFLTEIYRLHGMPKTIVSDRDRIFVSKFWKEIFRLSGTTLAFSSAYHPESDGQTEVVNRILQTYLRCFACDAPNRWLNYLHLAEFWYNSSY